MKQSCKLRCRSPMASTNASTLLVTLIVLQLFGNPYQYESPFSIRYFKNMGIASCCAQFPYSTLHVSGGTRKFADCLCLLELSEALLFEEPRTSLCPWLLEWLLGTIIILFFLNLVLGIIERAAFVIFEPFFFFDTLCHKLNQTLLALNQTPFAQRLQLAKALCLAWQLWGVIFQIYACTPQTSGR